ncbi:MAG: MFS transporter [Deltaproteobacteria bacterium CG11_big_fil_rev_8_21_14_0_20_49_13]|nr:MAG: MFS transporter [Deltaproteobacteria bacterium CG11_big_fil_rev_8_21_14_0_20_49_13]
MKKVLGLAKPVFVLGIVSLLTDLSSEMIYPILPLFLANTIGASAAFIGLVEGIAESTASLLRVFSGWISDRFNRRKELLVAGYGLSSIVKPFLALAITGWNVLGLRFLDRLGKGVRGAPRDAMIADVTEANERGKAFGYHRAMDTVGAILGPGVTFILLAIFSDSYRTIFLFSAIPAFLAVAVIIFAVKENRTSEPRSFTNGSKASLSFKGLSSPFILLLVIIGIFTIGNSSDAFLLLRAQNVGVTTMHVPLVWLFFNLVYTLVAIPAGKWSDKVGRRRVILTGFGIYALSYLGFAFASMWWHIWFLFGIYGCYYGMTEGVIRAYIADVVPASNRATSYGVYSFVTGILLFPANLLTGLIWKYAGPSAAFSLGAALALISAVSFYIFSQRLGNK